MSALVAQAITLVALTLGGQAMSAGDSVTVDGVVSTTWDGARFEPADLFDAEAGGLALAERSAGHARFVATGRVGAACAAAGLPSPCLVPRLDAMAHARLLTVDELRATLRGGLAVEIHSAPSPPPPSRINAAVALAAIAAGIAALFAIAQRRLEATPLGRVRAAAKIAERATHGDPTLGTLRDEIARLRDEAAEVERARRACEATLAAAMNQATRAQEEEAELRRLLRDRAAAEARLAEIAAALRLVPLRVREHRDLSRKLRIGGAMGSLTRELDARDRAIAEAERT